MFLQNTAIQKYIKQKFALSKTDISLMEVDYYNELPEIILNEILLYLEKNEDQAKIDELMTLVKNASNKQDDSDQQFIDKVEYYFKNIPEIKNNVDDRLQELDEALTLDLTDTMSDEEMNEFFKNGIQEIQELEGKIETLKATLEE